MKKTLLNLLAPVALVSAMLLTSCGGKSEPEYDDQGNLIKGKLNVVVLNAGYGDIWIKNACEKWEHDNPGWKINLNADDNAKSVITKNIASKKSIDDLYISVGTDWRTYAASGKFLPLDDLIEEEVDGVKLKNKIRDEYKNSIYYTNSKGEKHCYRLPWTSGTGGIYYNAKMFKDNGWDTWLKQTYTTNTTGVPETYDELVALTNKIKEDRVPVKGSRKEVVKPFVFSGQNTDYFDYTVLTWWGQIAGKEKVDEFLKYTSAKSFDASIKDSAYAALKEATKLWDDLYKDPNNYVTGSANKSNHQAQQNFLNGQAAMMFNGDWLYNETVKYTDDKKLPDSFDLRIMKTPAAPNAVDKNISYIVGEDQYIAIPKSSQHVAETKSLIKTIVSNWGCENFLDNANSLLAYNFNSENYEAKNTYVESLMDYRNSTTTTFTNFSSSLMYLNGIIDIWGTGAMRPFQGILSGTTTVDNAFQTIKSETDRQWSTWQEQAGI